MEGITIRNSRTPELIAAEINSIREQTKRQVLWNSIEIGRKLTEAKSLVKHGEWGKWLEEEVDYSKSTANNLMKIFEEYGAEQITLLGNNAKSQAIGNLNYTQAIALLGIQSPKEREEFIESNNVEDMSSRELKRAIAELNSVKEEKEIVIKKVKEFEKKSNEEKEKTKKIEAENKKLSEEVEKISDKLLKDLNSKNKDILEARQESEELKIKIKELEERPVDVITGVDEERTKELEEKHRKEIETLKAQKKELEDRFKDLEIKLNDTNNENLVKFKVIFDGIVENFKILLSNITEMDEDNQKKYKVAAKGLLNKMLEVI